ncbi:MAG: hypothetical protein AMS22_03460 [Thiotrichales bacterium SG8_50]|nr:MAG: hypothetical protein AMS22_03460 [Thiotrichales bacterium SG8_50]
MSILTNLVTEPGVLAAGEFAYRGDRFKWEGEMNEEMARLASIMCRTNNMAVHMQTDMMKMFAADCGCLPARGWVVRGQNVSVCVVGNVFCMIDNEKGSATELVHYMLEHLDAASDRLV